jgi:hypothetical protein
MLTLVEKILFAAAVLVSLYFTGRGVGRIIRLIGQGQGRPDWKMVARKTADALVKFVTFKTVFRLRPWPSFFHALIGWGFLSFLLVNLSDLLYGYTGFRLLDSTGRFGDFYRLLADVANAAILIGIVAMAVRRFLLRPETLSTRTTTLLDPRARTGILRDSAIVAGFSRGKFCSCSSLCRKDFFCRADARLMAAICIFAGSPLDSSRYCSIYFGDWHSSCLLDFARCGGGLPALFPLFQTYPSILCADQFCAQT